MLRVGILGATGYAGAELVRILSGHPEVTLTFLTSTQYAGKRFNKVYPAMTGRVEITLEAFDPVAAAERADVVFTALPHKLPMEVIPGLLERGLKVIDLSADFRFNDPLAYERHYQAHTAPELLKKTVYGLSEVFTDAIAGASLVGNPGCYPTCSLLPLIPLVRDGLVDPQSIIIDAKSGVSGAGRSPSLKTLFSEVAESFKPYNVGFHRHTPEIEAVLSRVLLSPVHVVFVPHLVPMSRGMLSTTYAALKPDVGSEALGASLLRQYEKKPFIRILEEGEIPDTLHVRATNFCDIGFVVDQDSRRVILMSAIDNLVKGAAGQAVQNMNLMHGIVETTGLTGIPYPI